MDMYMNYGFSSPIGVLSSSNSSSRSNRGTEEAAADHRRVSSHSTNNSGYYSIQLRQQQIQSPTPPAEESVKKQRCVTSRSVGEINTSGASSENIGGGLIKDTSDEPSPFRRAFSNSFHPSLLLINRSSLRKHQSLKENKNSPSCQSTKPIGGGEDSESKVPHFGPRGLFWRASKRLFSSSKVNTTEDSNMPAPKVISRDDAQIPSTRRPMTTNLTGKSRQRQRTASPPSSSSSTIENRKEEKNNNRIGGQSSSSHTSPFRSLPNAKKKLKSLMKWTSPGSSTACLAQQQQQAPVVVGQNGKSNKRGTNTRSDDWTQQTQTQSSQQAMRAIHPIRKSDSTDRVQECLKDLNVSLRFLDDVVKKDKLLMLAGSAGVVLDTTLKLLLTLDEKQRRESPNGNESQVFLEAYTAVCHRLAALVKFADQLVVKDETATPSQRQETAQLCQALKDSIQVLLAIATNELPFDEQTTKTKKNVTDRGVRTDMELRKSSLASCASSTSSSAADWAAEDEGEARLQHLDDSFENGAGVNDHRPTTNGRSHPSRRSTHKAHQKQQQQQRQSVSECGCSTTTSGGSRPLSSISTSSSSGCCVSSSGKSTCPPSTLQLNQRHMMTTAMSNGGQSCGSPANVSNGSRSPPGSDSGIFSLNDTGVSASFSGNNDTSSLSNSSLTAQTQSGTAVLTSPVVEAEGAAGSSNSSMFLDEILAKLKLSGAATIQERICDQQNTSNGDVETVTEEVEEMVGDTRIIRKKIITRQKVRTQQVVTARITTQYPMIDSPEADFLHLLAATSPMADDLKLSEIPWQKRNDSSDEKEFKIVDKEHYRLAGGNRLNDLVKLQESCESLPPAPPPPPPIPPRTTTRPQSDLDETDGAVKNGTEPQPRTLTNKHRQQSIMQQSSSLQSFSRQMLFNGKLIKTEMGEQFDASAIKASKSETFDEHGRVSECRGGGSYAECSYAKGDRILSHPANVCCGEQQASCGCVNGGDPSRLALQKRQAGAPPQPPPRPPKRSVVSSYVQLFGTGTPSNQADFRSSTLATYVQLRDRWNDHFEAHKRKAMTFQFVSTPNSTATQPSNNANGGNGTTNGSNGAAAESNSSSTSSSSSSPKMSGQHRISRTFHEYVLDGEDGGPVWIPRKPQDDYQNLINILNVNDHLKLPKQQAAVEAGVERKSLPFRTNLAIADVNLMDEIDVKQHLVCKKSANDDGPEIRGGPADALIVHATKTTSDAAAACGGGSSASSSSSNASGFCYQEAFLTTYRTFVAPFELIRKLVHRYNRFNSCVDDGVKKKAAKNTFSLLVRVVDDLSPVDINDDVMRLLSDFIYRMIMDGELNFSRLLRQKLMERYKIKRYRAMEETSPLYPSVSSSTSNGTISKYSSVLDFKASLLAEQFTFLDWYYFQKIELSEMLLWAQEQSEENSPNLTSFTEHFNKMSYWVRTRILEQADQKDRERVFAKFVKIMRHLRRLNNFNSCLALLSALDSGPIRRLDWQKASVESMNEHSSLIDSSQSFKTYRMALAEAKPPCLPYIGLILQDLTFLHIGNPNNLPTEQCQGRRDILNFAKRWQQYTILDNMRRFKAWPYGIKKNDQVLSYLHDFNDYVSEDAMWDISERLKPRQQHNAPTGVARRILVSPS